MQRTIVAACAALVLGTAAAQQYKWTDKDGRVRYGDVPPPGVKATPLRPPSPAPAPAADSAAKGAPKGPLSPAEQEAEFRKRQAEARKAEEKEAQARREAEQARENCARARELQATLESGQRIVRTDAKGERYYLDEQQLAQELARARQLVAQWCK